VDGITRDGILMDGLMMDGMNPRKTHGAMIGTRSHGVMIGTSLSGVMIGTSLSGIRRVNGINGVMIGTHGTSMTAGRIATGATAVWHILREVTSIRSADTSIRKIVLVCAGFQALTGGRSATSRATATQQKKDVCPRTAILARV
jgi:hypothetical protein